MMARQPVKDISWYDFGVDMFVTHDLDPAYSALAMTTMPDDMLKRWCLAYWCYYSAGVASEVAEAGSAKFYDLMWRGSGLDGNEKWPRGMERRYFYGDSAANLLNGLEAYSRSPEKVVDAMTCHTDFQSISAGVQMFTGFGPWMGWKVADMAERVLCYDVDFSNSELGIYKDPVQGAAFIAYGDKHYDISLDELHDVCEDMEKQFAGHMAPPFMDRPINIQEVETVLCKYKAHCYGFYPFGNDSHHMAKALVGWGDLADEVRAGLVSIAPYAAGMERGVLYSGGGKVSD